MKRYVAVEIEVNNKYPSRCEDMIDSCRYFRNPNELVVRCDLFQDRLELTKSGRYPKRCPACLAAERKMAEKG